MTLRTKARTLSLFGLLAILMGLSYHFVFSGNAPQEIDFIIDLPALRELADASGAPESFISEIRVELIAQNPIPGFASQAGAFRGDPPNVVGRMLSRVLIKDHDRPDEAIARIDRPILVIHGTADRIIPASHGRRLADAGPTADLVEIDGGDHNGMRTSHPQIDRLVIEFFRRTLPES